MCIRDSAFSGFTDDNQSWLTPKSQKGGKKRKLEPEEDEEEEEEEAEEEEGSEDDSDIPNDEFEEAEDSDGEETGSEASDDDDDDDEDDEDMEEGEDGDDDDLLPIEKASAKLDKRRLKMEKLAKAEMKLNMMDKEIFTLPSGKTFLRNCSYKRL